MGDAKASAASAAEAATQRLPRRARSAASGLRRAPVHRRAAGAGGAGRRGACSASGRAAGAGGGGRRGAGSASRRAAGAGGRGARRGSASRRAAGAEGGRRGACSASRCGLCRRRFRRRFRRHCCPCPGAGPGSRCQPGPGRGLDPGSDPGPCRCRHAAAGWRLGREPGVSAAVTAAVVGRACPGCRSGPGRDGCCRHWLAAAAHARRRLVAGAPGRLDRLPPGRQPVARRARAAVRSGPGRA